MKLTDTTKQTIHELSLQNQSPYPILSPRGRKGQSGRHFHSSPILGEVRRGNVFSKGARAFTLVELIIVITILAILATIAFVSFQNYAKDTRDAVRVSDITNASKGLTIFFTKSGVYPETESGILIKGNNTILSSQGKLGESVVRAINMNQVPLDPADQTKYVYSTSDSRTKYQLMTYTENSRVVSLLPQTYAVNYSERGIDIVGDELGVVLNGDNSLPSGDLDTTTGSTNYKVLFDNATQFESSGNLVFSQIYNMRDDLLKQKGLASLDDSLVGYWDMETLTGNLLKDWSKYENNGTLAGGMKVGSVSDFGKNSNATYFDGIDDYINVGKIFNGNIPAFTTTFLVQYDIITKNQCGTDKNTYTPIISSWNAYNNGTNEQGLRFGINNHCTAGSSWYFNVNNTNYFMPAIYDMQPYNTFAEKYLNKPYFISIVYNKGNIKVFINDRIIIDKFGLIQSMLDGENDLYIGNTLVNHSYFKGTIDEVRIYNRALSDSEIKVLYQARK